MHQHTSLTDQFQRAFESAFSGATVDCRQITTINNDHDIYCEVEALPISGLAVLRLDSGRQSINIIGPVGPDDDVSRVDTDVMFKRVVDITDPNLVDDTVHEYKRVLEQVLTSLEH